VAGAESLRLPSGAVSLDAVLERPDGAPRGWAAIAHPHPAHGGHRDHSVVRAVADAATAAGLAALRFDFRGVRASGGEVSDLEGHVEDVLAAAARAALEAPRGVAIGAGYSYGARRWLDAETAPGAPAVAGLLLLAPPTRIPQTSRDFGHLLLGRPLRAATVDRTATEQIARLTLPVHVVVGSDDVVAPASEYEGLGRHVVVHALPGLNHFFARGPGAGATALDALRPALDAAIAAIAGP
jgi:alpha/beta superfamily hydrolase